MPKAQGVLFCGGGTGGHVLPGLAVAAQLKTRGVAEVRWIGDPARLEARLVPRAGITLLPLGLSRPRLRSPRWLWAATRQVLGCWRELTARPPRVIVALGGYAALAPGILAPLLRRPLIVMEQNARPGRTNRLLARFARVVITQFPEASAWLPHRRALMLGNPVRAIAVRPRGGGRAVRLLVVGGSLAARTLNDLMLAAAPGLAGLATLEIVHLAGEEDCARVAHGYREAGLSADVRGFVDDMPELYRSIDLAVTRAGATTVAELCAAGIPAIYIPLPWAADDHQTANARSIAAIGGAILLPQEQAAPAALAGAIQALVADRAGLARMGKRARALARPHAAACVAQLLRTLSTRDQRRVRRSQARAQWQHALCQERGQSAQQARIPHAMLPRSASSAGSAGSVVSVLSPTIATVPGGTASENA